MRRRLFNLLAGTSLLLCVATAALWVRSYFLADELRREVMVIDDSPRHAGSMVVRRVGSNRGGVYLARQAQEFGSSWDTEPGRTVRNTYANDGPERDSLHGPLERDLEAMGWLVEVRPDWRRLGFRHSDGMVAGESLTYTVIPYWFLTLTLAALPAGAAMKHGRRAKRRRRGLCPACGYDLRATPDRCPECGAVPKQGIFDPK